MRQVLSWAFARSPGERSLACALLASFWDCGLFFPWYGILACVLPCTTVPVCYMAIPFPPPMVR
jgi:hypothetical protein